MRVYTTDGQSYEVNYIELWSDKEYVFTMQTKSGDLLNLTLDEFDRAEE